jgi:hypothetical protein
VVPHEGNGVVHQVLGQVVAGPGHVRHRMVILVQVGVPVVHETAQEAVPAAEASTQRPLVVRPRGRIVRQVGQMPLAYCVSAEALLRQDFRHGTRVRRDAPLVAWKAA